MYSVKPEYTEVYADYKKNVDTSEISGSFQKNPAMCRPKMSTFWTFCSIIGKSWVEFEKWAVVSELKLEMWKNCRPLDIQFQLLHQRTLFQCYCTFLICGPFVKTTTFRFLKICVLTKLSDKTSMLKFQKMLIFCCFWLIVASYIANLIFNLYNIYLINIVYIASILNLTVCEAFYF